MKILERSQNKVSFLSPAKVNLYLKVTGKRDDGYHGLLTVMQKISLYDAITVEKSEGRGIRLDSDMAGVPAAKNIVFRAAEAFYEKAGISPSVEIRLAKKIPVGGGLGGGSSDAAHVLRGLNLLHGSVLPGEDLYAIAATLGADVPFFLKDGTWLMKGRGDVFLKRIRSARFYYLLYNAGFNSETQRVFRNFAFPSPVGIASPAELIRGLERKKAHAVKREIDNDLLSAYLKTYPEQELIFMDLKNKLCQNTFLSGSGSTLYAIFDDRRKAFNAFHSLDNQTRKHVLTAQTL
jgi:4-diphosphocytidyl-2-C-methyl-D-erythritol kinase